MTEVVPYEFLARFKNGQPVGMHIREILMVDGKEIKELDPREITTEDKEFKQFTDLFNTAVVIERDAVIKEIDRKEQVIKKLNEQVEQLKLALIPQEIIVNG